MELRLPAHTLSGRMRIKEQETLVPGMSNRRHLGPAGVHLVEIGLLVHITSNGKRPRRRTTDPAPH